MGPLKLTEYIFAAAAGLIGSLIQSQFADRGPLLALLTAAAATIFTVLVLSVIWYLVRRYVGLDERFNFVGRWCDIVENHPNGTLISVNSVRYSFVHDQFYLEGFAYRTHDTQPFSTWGSIVVTFPEPHRLYAIHRSKMLHQDPPDITGITRMSFSKDKGSYFEGIGDLVENTNPPNRLDFTFRRVSDDDLHSLIQKKAIENDEDRYRFVQAIASKYNLLTPTNIRS